MSQIRLVPATPAQKPVIANLIQLYLHDLTEVMPFPVGYDGRFGYDFLDRFWRFPYFIMSGAEIAGFALVIDSCPLTGRSPCWFMAEFFVLRPYRKQGAGNCSGRPGSGSTSRPMAHRNATCQPACEALLEPSACNARSRSPRHSFRRRRVAVAPVASALKSGFTCSPA